MPRAGIYHNKLHPLGVGCVFLCNLSSSLPVDSISGVKGTPESAVAPLVGSRLGSGVMFTNGTSHAIYFNVTSQLTSITNSFTVCAWVTCNYNSQDRFYVGIRGGGTIGWAAGEGAGYPSFFKNDTDYADGSVNALYNMPEQFVVWVVNSSYQMTCYINGKYSGVSTNTTAIVAPTSTTLCIGSGSTTDNTWGGLVSQVRIYNRMLSVSEIQTLYNHPFIDFGSTPTWRKSSKN